MCSDNGIHVQQPHSVTGAALSSSNNPVVLYQHRLLYRVADGENQLTVFQSHFKLDYPAGIQLFAGGDCIVKQIAKEYDDFLLADAKTVIVIFLSEAS